MDFDENVMDQGSSGCSSSVPSTPDLDWTHDALSKCFISRKRKSTQPLDFINCDEDRERRSSSDSDPSEQRRVKLSDKAKKVVQLYPNVFSEDKILHVLLQCLPDEDLRRLATVSSKWRNQAYRVLRKRAGNGPFILFWETRKSQTYDEFYTRIGFHYDPIWLNGVDTTKTPPLSSMISFSTSYCYLNQNDFNSVSAITEQRLSFFCALGTEIAAGLPTGNHQPTLLKVSDKSHFALQTLCIPWHANISCVSVSVPPWMDKTHDETFRALVDRHFPTRDELARAYKPVNWILVLQCCEDKLCLEFMDAYVTGGGVHWDNVGGILANVEGIVSDILKSQRNISSGIMNIHGGLTMSATYAFNVRTDSNFYTIQLLAQAFFQRAENSFAIMVYGPSVTGEYLAKLKAALGNPLIIGILTDQPISFQGTFLDESSSLTYRYNFSNSAELGVDVAIGLIRY